MVEFEIHICQEERKLIPFQAKEPLGENVLVLSPHPDDESLGLGGTLRLLSAKKKDISIIFLTSGDKADPQNPLVEKQYDKKHVTDYSLLREKEAVKAMKILKVNDVTFLRFPDRELSGRFEELFHQLKEWISRPKREMIDTLYVTSPLELNPDHRVAARIALALQTYFEFRIVFYEISVPLRPNYFVDISSTKEQKWKAIRAYRSQLELIDYLSVSKGLNKFRSLTLGKKIKYAEAFYQRTSPLTQHEFNQWFSYQSEKKHY